MSSPPNFDDSLDKRIDGVCDEFEAAWKSGSRPVAEDYAARVPDGAQEIFLALLSVEYEYLQKAGEPTDRERFLEGHPGWRDAVNEFFDSRGVRAERTIAGHYELVEEIGSGSQGVVHKAYDPRLKRFVALKRIRDTAGNEGVRTLLHEAQKAAQLKHEGIVTVYEVGHHAGQSYIAMEFVDGGSLWRQLQVNGPYAPREAAKLMELVAKTMHFAHQKGIIHRDLKPHNILLDREGRPFITDFGLAKRVADDSTLTLEGQVMGTPSYMPPEQALGQLKLVNVASDVYSLGATLYAMLTGRPPFQAASMALTLRQVVESDPVSPRALNSDVARDLETICLKCLAKEPNKRYDTAAELAVDLNCFVDERPLKIARRTPSWEVAWKWCRRHPARAGLAATSVLMIAALGVAGALSARNAHLSAQGMQLANDKIKAEAEAANAQVKAFQSLERNRLRAQELLTRSEASFQAGDYQDAEANWNDASVLRPTAADELALWDPLLRKLDHADRKRQIQEAARFVRIADRTEHNFGKTIFLSIPVALQGADKESDIRAANSVAQAEFERLRAEAPDPQRPAESIARLAGPRDEVSGRAAEFVQQAKHLKRLVEQSELPEDPFDRGLALLERPGGTLEDARVCFAEKLRETPDHYWARFALGATYLRRGEPELADANFSTCEAMHTRLLVETPQGSNVAVTTPAVGRKRSSVAWLHLLRGLARAQQIDAPDSIFVPSALADFDEAERLLAEDPGNNRFPLYFLRANRSLVRLRNQQYEVAIRDARSLINESRPFPEISNDPTAHFHLALACLRRVESDKQFDTTSALAYLYEGNAALSEAIRRHGKSRKFLGQKAVVFFLAANFEKEVVSIEDAIQSLTEAVTIARGTPNDTAEEYVMLAQLRLKQFVDSQSAVVNRNSSVPFWAQVLGELDLAIDAVARGRFRSSETRAQAYLLRASARFQSIQPMIARQTIVVASEKDSHEAVRQLREQLDRVIADATQVGYLPCDDEKRRLAHALRGHAAELLPNYRMAWNDYRVVLELLAKRRGAGASDDAEKIIWMMRRGWVALTPSVQEWKDARDQFEQILKLRPTDPHAMAGAACALLRFDNYSAAKTEIDRAVELLKTLADDGQTVEVRRRVYHAKADIYAAASFFAERDGSRKHSLQQQAVAALRKVFPIDQDATTVDFQARRIYWMQYIEVDPDLAPLYENQDFLRLRDIYRAAQPTVHPANSRELSSPPTLLNSPAKS